MAWNNNVPTWVQSGINQGRNRQSGYVPNYNPSYPVMIRKRSGAKIQERDGAVLISAWKKNRKGFYVLYARPCRKTKEVSSKNGKNWLNLFVTITNRSTMEVQKFSGLYDVDRRRLYIKDLNQIVTTGGNGGYWGRHIGGKNNRRY